VQAVLFNCQDPVHFCAHDLRHSFEHVQYRTPGRFHNEESFWQVGSNYHCPTQLSSSMLSQSPATSTLGPLLLSTRCAKANRKRSRGVSMFKPAGSATAAAASQPENRVHSVGCALHTHCRMQGLFKIKHKLQPVRLFQGQIYGSGS
jgi:hypothetical protein